MKRMMMLGVGVALTAMAGTVTADLGAAAPTAEAAASAHDLMPVTVIGSKAQVARLPGSGEFLDVGDIRSQSYADINQVLRRVPGVYVREEDGHGLFPNISLRGVDGGRSAKVTVMEDGVLAAPAPYAAPAAYYAPSVGRMNGIEVLKGSSQIQYGPQTSGGVIHYLATPIPRERTAYARLLYGTDNTLRNHVYLGDRVATDLGRFGYVIELFEDRTDGFKTIDPAPGFTDNDQTGFAKREPMLKLSWEPPTERYHLVEFKLGYTELTAHETYLGLTDGDFDADPYRRYAASRFDRIDTRMTRTHLRHLVELSPDARLTSTLYYHDFKRNWFKDRTSGADLGDPQRLAVVKGESAGTLRYRNNNREYYSAGGESILNLRGHTGAYAHDIDFGVRLHQDQAKRFQRDDEFVQADNGAILARNNGVPGGGGNREENAEALALFVQDAITRGPVTVVPGLRYERVRFDYTDFDTKGQADLKTGEGDATLDLFAPGLGLVVALTPATDLFGGVYRGFSLPDARAHAKDGIKEETSLGYELGMRYRHPSTFQSELALFYTDFSDLIVPDIIGAGGGSANANVGDVVTWGAEAKLAFDLGAACGWGFRNPWYASATWTQAELDSDTTSGDVESIFSGGRKGAEVPYVPEYQALIGTGLETERWGVFVDVSAVDATYTTASNVEGPVDLAGSPDESYGKTDARVIVDLSGYRRLSPNVKLLASVHNLFDEEYVAARHPAGARPGKPQTALAGLELVF